MKQQKMIFLIVTFFLLSFPVKAFESELYSRNIILYNLDENKILYEKNAEEVISIASMTKIMTAIVALENISNLDDKVMLTGEDFLGLEEANASVAGFKEGDVVTYRDLLYGLLLPSGADAANALTRTIKVRETFLYLMNEKAQELGMENTHFVNETGLDQENHYSTVKDVAKLFSYALLNEEFRKIITSSTYQTTNHLIFESITSKAQNILDMKYLLGGKTGSTFQAGLCLASFAFSKGTYYMLVTAGASYQKKPYHLLDAKTIYEYYMQNFKEQKVISKGENLLSLKTKYAKEDKINFYSEKEIQKYLPSSFQKKDLSFHYSGILEVTPFMKQGTKLGNLNITYHGEKITSINIILEKKLSLDLIKYINNYRKEFAILVLLILFIIIILKRIKQIKKI